MKLLIFIVNKKAGNGKGIKVWDKLKQELDEKKIKHRSFFTNYPNHAQELARQIGSMYEDKVEAVIAVGGDGTINEVVNGMVHYPKIKVGYIPAGSGNDFSRGFKVPKTPREALSFIIQNKTTKGMLFDIGKCKVDEKTKYSYFVSSLGTGFDAAVAKLTNESKMKKYLNKLHLGSLAYVGALIRLLFTYRLTNIKVHVDGKDYQFEKVWFVTVSNQPFYGGGMKIAPQAKTRDGYLDVTVVRDLSRIKLLLVFATVYFGTHTKFKEISQLKGTVIRVESNEKMLVHADGELIGQTPVQVEVQYRKMSFLAK